MDDMDHESTAAVLVHLVSRPRAGWGGTAGWCLPFRGIPLPFAVTSETQHIHGSDVPSATTWTVAIIDRAPTYRAGLSAALLKIGAETVELTSPSAAAGLPDAWIVATIDSLQAWNELIAAGVAQAQTVALCTQLDPVLWEEILASGAAGVADWAAPPETLAATIRAAASGELRLPVEFVRALVQGSTKRGLLDLTEDEVRWLRRLAEGATVRELHTEEHMSERVLYRHLQNLYLRLGARNRDQAIAKASKAELLD